MKLFLLNGNGGFLDQLIEDARALVVKCLISNFLYGGELLPLPDLLEESLSFLVDNRCHEAFINIYEDILKAGISS